MGELVTHPNARATLAARLVEALATLEMVRSHLMYAASEVHRSPQSAAGCIDDALSEVWGAEGTLRLLGGALLLSGHTPDTTIDLVSALGAELVERRRERTAAA